MENNDLSSSFKKDVNNYSNLEKAYFA